MGTSVIALLVFSWVLMVFLQWRVWRKPVRNSPPPPVRRAKGHREGDIVTDFMIHCKHCGKVRRETVTVEAIEEAIERAYRG